ncbi:MAG: class I SAM-dependent methyltransferase [Candidatus Magasanikbacteria bacterium]|nr:class I SAM-dependent methyltransferase [Candidatus Magasanikbacteria bacterium]
MSQKNTQEYWDTVYKKVDTVLGPTLFVKKVSTYFSPPKHILDVCCGDGKDSLYFATLGYTVTATDISAVALFDNLQKNNLDIERIQSDVRELVLDANIYDVVYSCLGLHYFSWEETKKIFANLVQSLKLDGYICVRVKSIYDADYGKGEKQEGNLFISNRKQRYFFSKEEMEKLFFENNIEIICSEYVEDVLKRFDKTEYTANFVDIIGKKLMNNTLY